MSWKSMLMAMAIASNEDEVSLPAYTEITDADAEAIRVLINKQLTAFREGDAQGAYELSSAAIRQTFSSPSKLMQIIRAHYPSLADPRRAWFGDYTMTPDGIGQLVRVADASGTHTHLVYLVVKEADGSWRINGCVALREESAAMAA